MTRPNVILRIVIPASLIAAIVFSLVGRLLAAPHKPMQAATTPVPMLLVDNVQVKSCGAIWTADRKWIACGIFRGNFDP